MKLHWQETELHRGKHRQVKREVDLVFIEKEPAYVNTHPAKIGEPTRTVEHTSYHYPLYTVAILRVKGRKGVFSGVARFSDADDESFDFARGRKLALGRALREAFPYWLPGRGVVSRQKAWYSYRLQVEMEAVKKEEARLAQREMVNALVEAKVNLKASRFVVDIEGPGGLQGTMDLISRLHGSDPLKTVLVAPDPQASQFECGCWDITEVCPLHSAPRKLPRKEVKPDGDANSG